jgi:hypothetical protein
VEVSAYDLWKDAIGMVDDGPRDLSVNSGAKARRMLLVRRKR